MGNPLMSMINGGMNPLANNPVMKLVQMMKGGGGNPQQLLQQMASQNPQMKPIMDMMSSGNTQGLKDMAMNMAKERGTSVEEIAKQIGIELPK